MPEPLLEQIINTQVRIRHFAINDPNQGELKDALKKQDDLLREFNLKIGQARNILKGAF